MSRDIPVIMSAPMVRAAWYGRKTQTRRLRWTGRKAADGHGFYESVWARVRPGDRLWVRENWSGPYKLTNYSPREMVDCELPFNAVPIWYWADGRIPTHGDWTKPLPSIHMPRAFSRLTLIVTATKMERLQDIGEEDCIAEGCCVDSADGQDVWYIPGSGMTPHKATGPECFRWLWESLHGPDSWRENPELFVIGFRVIKANIDAPEAQAA